MDRAEIQAARDELAAKTKEQIEAETAHKWCARGIAAYEFYASGGERRWLLDANAYHGEAIEHAAHANIETLDAVEAALAAALHLALNRVPGR